VDLVTDGKHPLFYFSVTASDISIMGNLNSDQLLWRNSLNVVS